MSRTAAILLAAGSSRRMAGAVPDKILAPLAGKPAFAHTAATFVRSGAVDFFVVTYGNFRFLLSELWGVQVISPQVQAPLTQVAPVPQSLPHIPQLASSLETSTQAPPHTIWLPGQAVW